MSEQQFRVGGAYLTESGLVVQIKDSGRSWACNASVLIGHSDGCTAEWLRDGSYFNGPGGSEMHLIPGELHCVNGEWVPFGELIHPASVMHTPYSEDRQSGVRTPVLAPRHNAAMMLRDATAAATAWHEKQQAKADRLAAEEAKRNAPLPCPAGFGYRPDQAPTGHQFGQFAKR